MNYLYAAAIVAHHHYDALLDRLMLDTRRELVGMATALVIVLSISMPGIVSWQMPVIVALVSALIGVTMGERREKDETTEAEACDTPKAYHSRPEEVAHVFEHRETTKTLTRQEAVAIIARHGWQPDSLTAAQDGAWVDGTSFDDEVGVSGVYCYRCVYLWLGYDFLNEILDEYDTTKAYPDCCAECRAAELRERYGRYSDAG